MLGETQRVAALQAMGIDVYRLRSADAPTERPVAADVAACLDVVVVCPRAAGAGPPLLRRHLPRVLGAADARVHWHEAEAADLQQDAAAYIAIGTAAARALGVQLSTMQQNSAVMVTTAEPAELLRGATAKRALWHALKPVARTLRRNG